MMVGVSPCALSKLSLGYSEPEPSESLLFSLGLSEVSLSPCKYIILMAGFQKIIGYVFVSNTRTGGYPPALLNISELVVPT